MFYEDVKLYAAAPSLDKLVWRYGHKTTDLNKIWDDPQNTALRIERTNPANVKVGDIFYIPIPWRVTTTPMSVTARGVDIKINRDGGRGRRLKFVQTVNRSNQPFGPVDVFCTDPCIPDDPVGANEPFYFTKAELKTLPKRRKQMRDLPTRNAPTIAQGTTKWRAVTSIACITGKRVTIFETRTWGFNITPANVITMIRPRRSSGHEIRGHLTLLRTSAGGNFKSAGWSFRTPPLGIRDK